MKTCVISKPFEFQINEGPIPIPKANEVVVKMMAAGVCGSDIHIYKGENPLSKYPLVPGHENVGIVTEIGKDCKTIKVGDHVVVDLIITCDECYQCTHERGNVCESVLVRGSGTDGGWREYFTVIESDVYKIDSEIPWKDAVLIEPLAIGEHCTNRARISNDDIVFIFGAGTIGTIVAQACKIKGAKTVICCDIDSDNLERSKNFGADFIINSKTENVIETISKITNGHGCTVAFDSACFPGSLEFIMQNGIVGNAGRIVPLGFSSNPENISQADINKREIDIIGTRMSLNQFETTAKKMAEKKYNLEGLATTFIKFSEVEKVFDNILNPKPSIKKQVILFNEAEDLI